MKYRLKFACTFNSSYYREKKERIEGKMELHLGGLTIKIDSVLTSGSPCVKRNGKMRTEKSIKGERRGENARRSIIHR